MSRHTSATVLIVCLSVLIAVAIVGCSSSGNTSDTSGTGTNTGSGMMGGTGSSGGGTSGMMGGGGSGTGSDASVGERIYLTGVGSDGKTISHTAPRVSQGSLMMGGGGCGSCHSADGKGGTIRMMTGTAIKAPDITYGALIKAGFEDATIRTAITDGLDESGESLNVAMPRWRMGTTDLDATISYLKQLGS